MVTVFPRLRAILLVAAAIALALGLASAPAQAVETPTVRNLTAPTVFGTFQTDHIVGSTTGTWSPGGNTYAVQWFADGVAIEGATGSTYKITAADVTKKLSVRVTASRDGYNSASSTSAPSVAVAPGTVVNSSPPTLFGVLKVGSTVGVNAGTWSPAAVSWTYRWFADGAL